MQCDLSLYYQSIMEPVDLKYTYKMSNSCFEDIVRWVSKYQRHVANWPALPDSWLAVEKLLEEAGCSLPKVYYICLNKEHPCHYDSLRSDSELCRHCGRPGSLKYYCLSLVDKVKAWSKHSQMCEKMTGYWKERSHWLVMKEAESLDSPGNILIKRRFGMG